MMTDLGGFYSTRSTIVGVTNRVATIQRIPNRYFHCFLREKERIDSFEESVLFLKILELQRKSADLCF